MTPLISFDNFYLKREDSNITGSAKDRAIPYQLKNLLSLGFKTAVISSSGNAAISAAYYCQIKHIPLTVFVSPRIDHKKLLLIKKYSCNINFSLKPISQAIQFSKNHHSYSLRQSTDSSALLGYQNISREFMKQLPKITSIFIPVGSGTTLLGISRNLPLSIKIFAVQPSSNPTICKFFSRKYIPETKTVTDSLSVKYLPQKKLIIKTIKDHHGSGIIVPNKNTIDTQKYLETNNIFTSAEGALAVSGLLNSQKLFNIGKYPLIILTGAKR